MVKEAGQAIYGGREVSFTGDGTASPGDLVALDTDGHITQAGDGDNPIGVLTDQYPSHSDGDRVGAYVGGIVVGSVATDTSAGTAIGSSATAGEAGAGSKYDTLSDEGGEFKGATIADGYAAVNLG